MAKLLLGSVVGPQGPQGTPGVNGSQGPQGIPGPNEIAATTDVVGLTPGRLLYNKSGKVGSVEIVDNILSIDPYKPLSANQGKVLKGLIDGNSSAIGQLQTNKQDGITTIKDINCHSLIINKEYIINNTDKSIVGNSALNYPKVAGLFHLKVENTLIKDSTSGVYYTAKSRDYGTIYTKFEVNGVYSSWIEVATTEKKTPTLLNGWLANGNVFCAKSGKIATLNLRIRSGSMTQFSTIVNLPSGFEPSDSCSILVFARDVGGNPIGQIIISTNGSVSIFSLSSNSDVVINASWVTV